MKEYKDCLACSESFSEEASNSNENDKLFCMKHNKYVEENECCEDFN